MRVALVTGASAGIGEAVARRLRATRPDAQLVLVARREDRLRRLADDLGGARVIAADLADPEAPGRIARALGDGPLHLLVNNAGATWRGEFGDTGWATVARHLALDFESPVRLTEALLPRLRETAAAGLAAGEPERVALVNVASTGARVARPGTGGYSAAKAALAAFSDALHAEEGPRGIHVGLVLPGFIETEGFPASELRARIATRWLVSTPEVAADAVLDAAGWAGRRPRAERYTPRGYAAFAGLRVLAPSLVRRAVGGGTFTTASRPRD